jgi:predicted transporter
MTDDNEEVLRRSLDAVDRHRNRLLIGVVLAAVLLLLAFMNGADAVHTGNTNNLLHAIMLVLGIWTTILALAVIIQITVMTKRILRAIELASKK